MSGPLGSQAASHDPVFVSTSSATVVPPFVFLVDPKVSSMSEQRDTQAILAALISKLPQGVLDEAIAASQGSQKQLAKAAAATTPERKSARATKGRHPKKDYEGRDDREESEEEDEEAEEEKREKVVSVPKPTLKRKEKKERKEEKGEERKESKRQAREAAKPVRGRVEVESEGEQGLQKGAPAGGTVPAAALDVTARWADFGAALRPPPQNFGFGGGFLPAGVVLDCHRPWVVGQVGPAVAQLTARPDFVFKEAQGKGEGGGMGKACYGDYLVMRFALAAVCLSLQVGKPDPTSQVGQFALAAAQALASRLHVLNAAEVGGWPQVHKVTTAVVDLPGAEQVPQMNAAMLQAGVAPRKRSVAVVREDKAAAAARELKKKGKARRKPKAKDSSSESEESSSSGNSSSGSRSSSSDEASARGHKKGKKEKKEKKGKKEKKKHKKGKAEKEGPRGKLRCFRCGELGHLSYTCVKPIATAPASGGAL